MEIAIGTICPSPDGNDILLCRGSAQKIEWTAGLASKYFTKHLFFSGVQ